MDKLFIVIPAYNEADNIRTIMNKNLYPPFEMGAEAKP